MLCKISVMKVHVHCETEEPFLAPFCTLSPTPHILALINSVPCPGE
jgi:hypothetical protein